MGNITNSLFNARSLKTLAVLGMLTLTLGIAGSKAQAVTYDPFLQWSSSTNTLAGGVWSYGQAPLAAPTAFALLPDYVSNAVPGLDAWRSSSASSEPAIFHNKTTSTISSGSPIFPTDELVLHPGPTGDYSILRFTAPTTGIYSIIGQFIARDIFGTTTDVAVLNDSGAALFSGNVNGVNGTSAQLFSLSQSLVAGQNIDFRVGYGSNTDFNFDSTGLKLSVSTAAPEPGTLVLLSLGTLGVGAARRRRKE